MSNTNNRSGGIGILGLLTVAFIVLKLTDVIDWSWWGVLAPLWVPVALVIAIPAVLFGGAFAIDAFNSSKKKK